jgi:hypothetical protein
LASQRYFVPSLAVTSTNRSSGSGRAKVSPMSRLDGAVVAGVRSAL